MADSSAHRKAGYKENISEDEQLVLSWLRDVDQRVFIDDASESSDRTPTEPKTPLKPQPLVQTYDEVSPTNASFCSESIFDAPYLPDGTSIDDPFCDDIPGIAPADDKYAIWEQLNITIPDTQSLAWHNPPSGIVNDIETPHKTSKETPRTTTASPIDPDRPRFTRVTSCIQCILADLPCSRTPPYCSRCKRNGRGNVCLLHRQKYINEIDRSDATTCTTPVLLKLQGEDEIMWGKKKELAGELEQAWRDGEDRKNWVLPSLEGLVNSFRKDGARLRQAFPGEGKGRLTHRELHVAMDT
ncbi:hypothetical protein SVAN01_10497 [Stagonosporopsis vannaccii]|nr:hypothetical protein SVAN01_10497 [Stagonosporopsis vannaccii]